ncbi:MAG: ABC transporter permease subunit [Pseudomonadota bacterium]
MTAGLRFLPSVTVLVLAGPVFAGLAGTLVPALSEGGAAFRDLAAWPGLGAAVRLSLVTGIVATALSLLIATALTAGWWGTRAFRMVERLLSPLLSVPHAAAAFGLAFLIAPSGWIARVLSPWATGWERPPDLLIVQDPAGWSLIAGLVAKETPFLLLMTLAALPQAAPGQSLKVAESLGYGRVAGWLKVVFPRVYAQIRLPVYVVLAYSMSVVDVALILGPSTPPTLSVQITRWMSDPDLSLRLQAAAAALLQLGLVVLALGAWRLAEIGVARAGRAWVWSGQRCLAERSVRSAALVAGIALAAIVVVGLLGLAVWSVAGFWSFPAAWPDALTGRTWSRHADDIHAALADTVVIACLATGLALSLVIGCLEAEHRHGLRLRRGGVVILSLPLLVPQTVFLPGLASLLIWFGWSPGICAVVLAHLVFVLPYVFLSLGDPWRAWDTRFATAAAALGAGPVRVLFFVRLPMLIRPVLTAAAVGIAVSVGQYLPTLLVGGGRVATLTTEAVALGAGGDRRAIGAWGLVQTAAALLPFAVALVVPAILARRRRGLQGG